MTKRKSRRDSEESLIEETLDDMEPEGGASWFGLMGRMVRNLPGADFAEEQLQTVETRVLRELQQRMDRVSRPARLPSPENYVPQPSVSSEPQSAAPSSASLLGTPPSEVLADLLERAEQQTPEQARAYLYAMMLRELIPDEARLLGALSDGETHPLLHVGVGPMIGSASRRVAENFSNLGKTATLKLKDFTPAYITHLRNLDLVETGPEDKEEEIKYQILESDRATLEAVKVAEKSAGPGMSMKFIRRVIRISPLGQELWNYCHGVPENNG